MPKVSVITAAFNHAPYIRECLESVQNQSFRDFEHIVVDDGSSDGTSEILKDFGRTITCIRQENRGAHAAINRAIRASSGEYIAILDSDDAWLSNKLERQLELIERFPDAGLVYSRAHVIDSQGQQINERQPIGQPISNPEEPYWELVRDNPIPALTALFRRDCGDKLGWFNENLRALSDWDLWIRIADRWRVLFVSEPLALYRIHGKNTWDILLKNGRVDKEKLLLLSNAYAALTPSSPDVEKKRAIIDSAFKERALRTAYGLWYRHQYSAAKEYILFAVKVRPSLLRDALIAVRPRFIARLIAGERGTRLLKNRFN